MSVLCCVLFAYAFLQFCSAQGINCTVTQDDKQTTYNIWDAAHVSGVKASDCEYTWANASHMLAHNEDETPELVMSNGLNTLVTSECINTIIHRRLCASEGVLYTALCSINCTENAWFHKDKEISNNHIVAIIVPVLLLLLVLFSFLLYKFKNEILRICSCHQMRCIYTAQKTQDTVPEAAGTCNVGADEHFV
ncbi:uncharacterized protein LOC143332201 isoform X2 [Chaetodon auriga]|uniref:uncharacterized protein LOC143332201 isoform X2 n=1 Tax=Chaetodon auriga TaxID=39042 RepID=UPI004032E4E2